MVITTMMTTTMMMMMSTIKDVVRDVDVDRSWAISLVNDETGHSGRRHIVIDRKWYPTLLVHRHLPQWLTWNFSSPLLWRRVSGFFLLVGMLTFIELANTPWQIIPLTAPGMLVVTYTIFTGGFALGSLSVILLMSYSFYAIIRDGTLSDVSWVSVIIMIVALPLIALMVGLLRWQLDCVVRAREQLALQHHALQIQEKKLREAHEQTDAFIHLVSHELRTPLTGIMVAAQLAERKLCRITQPAENDQQKSILSLLSQVNRQTNNLARLVNDLLDASRIHTRKFQIHASPCDLALITRDVVETLRLTQPERLLTINTPATLPVVADAVRIEQVATNFLMNALKFSPADRPINVLIDHYRDQARVSVIDQGPGMTSDELERIWQRLYQVTDTSIQSGMSAGLGLGLYLSKAIIQQHGGEVGVKSAVGQGSTFWFTLPLP
jgi:signal transduction histidine kinase